MRITGKAALSILVILTLGAMGVVLFRGRGRDPVATDGPTSPPVAVLPPVVEEDAAPGSAAGDESAAESGIGNERLARDSPASPSPATSTSPGALDPTPAPAEPTARPQARRREVSGPANGASGSASPGGGATPVAPAAPDERQTAAGAEASPLTTFVEQPRPAPAPPPPGSDAPQQPGRGDEAVDAADAEPAAELAETPKSEQPPHRRRRAMEEPGPSSPPLVRMAAGSAEYAVGERVSIVVEIASAFDVGHVPFHVTFNPQVLQFQHAQEGVFLGSDGAQTAFFANPTSAGDTVVVGLSRLGRIPGVEGGGVLCVLEFDAVGAGSAGLGFARAKVRDSSNRIVPATFVPVAVQVR